MTCSGATSRIKVEIDHFIFYRKSKIGLIIGSLTDCLTSNGSILADEREDCKIKIKLDCVDLTKLGHARFLELTIQNFYEEKFYKGVSVKQFTAVSVSDYISDLSKKRAF